MRVGLSLFDFLASRGVLINALPSRFTSALDRIALDIANEVETGDFIRWEGTLPAKEFLEDVMGGRAIGIEKLAWRFTQLRDTTAVPDGEVENPPLARELRVDLAGVRVELPGDLGFPLHPADEISARGTDIAHLRAKPGEDRSALVGDLAFRTFLCPLPEPLGTEQASLRVATAHIRQKKRRLLHKTLITALD